MQRIPDIHNDPDDPGRQSEQVQHPSDPGARDTLLTGEIGLRPVVPAVDGLAPLEREGYRVAVGLPHVGPGGLRLADKPPELRPESSTYAAARGAIDTGRYCSQADLARKKGISRPRVTQILNLLRLSPRVTGIVRDLGDPLPSRTITERQLRRLINRSVQDRLKEIMIILGVIRSDGVRRQQEPDTEGG